MEDKRFTKYTLLEKKPHNESNSLYANFKTQKWGRNCKEEEL